MMKFSVVGTGPGGADYLLPIAAKEIAAADCLVGARRLLDEHRRPGQDVFEYRSNLKNVMDFLAESPGISNQTAGDCPSGYRVVVLVSGDPGFHSLLGAISRRFDTSEYRVIPGVSSFQLAMARRGCPWQSDLLLSCHGRDFDEIRRAVLQALCSSRRVILLTDRKRQPVVLAREILLSEEVPAGKESLLSVGDGAGVEALPNLAERRVFLAEDMALSGECFTETTLGELAAASEGEYRLCVMIVE